MRVFKLLWVSDGHVYFSHSTHTGLDFEPGSRVALRTI